MLELPDGLCIDFAIMKTSSRVREVWFQLASKSQVVDVIDHCVDKHVSMNSSVFRSLEGIRAVENGADSNSLDNHGADSNSLNSNPKFKYLTNLKI